MSPTALCHKSLLILLLSAFSMQKMNAQFSTGDLLDKGNQLLGNGLTKKLSREPISTSFSDCNRNEVLPGNFGEGKDKYFLCNQFFNKDSGWRLKPGFYKGTIKSFCLKAGTYGPSKGDGYLYAPILGPKHDLVFKLINNWKDHTDITQANVQLLLWAIIAKAKFKDLSPDLKLVAARLLSEDEREALSKVGIEFISEAAMGKVLANLPEPVQKIVALENQMRRKFYASSISYHEMEQLAVLAGMAPVNADVPRGLWSLHQDGYYVRYLPSGYSSTYIEVYVPEDVLNGQVYFNGCGQIATPANTGAQRLAQSDVILCEGDDK